MFAAEAAVPGAALALRKCLLIELVPCRCLPALCTSEGPWGEPTLAKLAVKITTRVENHPPSGGLLTSEGGESCAVQPGADSWERSRDGPDDGLGPCPGGSIPPALEGACSGVCTCPWGQPPQPPALLARNAGAAAAGDIRASPWAQMPRCFWGRALSPKGPPVSGPGSFLCH